MPDQKAGAGVLFMLLACVGSLCYGFFVFAALLGLRDAMGAQDGATMLDWLVGVMHALFFAGFPPITLVINFWVLESRTTLAKWGFVFVPLFIVLHYPVALFMAHGSPWTYIPMMLLELVACGAVIWYWRTKTLRAR